MFALTATLLTLLLGPILFRLARPVPAILPILDGFCFAAIGGLVLFEILPHSLHLAGPWVIPIAFLGLFGPSWAEKTWKRAGAKFHAGALVVALAGLLVHGFIDGMALTGGHMSLAVILHRLPVAITLWCLVRPAYGAGAAAGVLAAMGAVTTAGFFVGGSLVSVVETRWIGMFEALVAGTLFHVVVHATAPIFRQEAARPWHAGFGALLGITLLVYVIGGDTHDHDAHAGTGDFADLFYELCLTSAPALLIGYFAAGIVHGFLPKASLRWLHRGSNFNQSLRGLVFGLPLPICSCGVLPIYRSLVTQQVPMSAAMTLLVATPELGLDAVLLSVPLLGGELTLVRVIGAGIVAIAIGWGVGRLVGAAGVAKSAGTTPIEEVPKDFAGRARSVISVGLGELVDSTAPWVILGIAVAALVNPYLEAEWLRDIPRALEVPLFAFLGMPSYVCASGATPLVAILIAGGVSPGAGLAFLLTGPATNVTTFGVLSQLHGRRIALLFAGGMLFLSVALGFAVNAILDAPHLHIGHGHDHGSPIQEACLYALAVLVLISVLRQGPRAFVGQILNSHGDHDHEHGHDHGHGADHDHRSGASDAEGCCES